MTSYGTGLDAPIYYCIQEWVVYYFIVRGVEGVQVCGGAGAGGGGLVHSA